jgi:hypothetical protein
VNQRFTSASLLTRNYLMNQTTKSIQYKKMNVIIKTLILSYAGQAALTVRVWFVAGLVQSFEVCNMAGQMLSKGMGGPPKLGVLKGLAMQALNLMG